MAPRAMFHWSNTSESMMQATEYPPGSLNEIVVSLLRISTCRIGQQDRWLGLDSFSPPPIWPVCTSMMKGTETICGL
eukprot:scaffold46095_cov70-Attheya_sp.AAC.4